MVSNLGLMGLLNGSSETVLFVQYSINGIEI